MRVSTLLVLVVLAGLTGGWWLLQRQERRTIETRLAEVASLIAGRDVTISCPGTVEALTDVSNHAGSVRFDASGQPGDEAKVNAETCVALRDLTEGEAGVDDLSRVAKALHVLTHESWHLAGVVDEAAADCYAFQRVEAAALELGASPADARALAIRAYEERQLTAPPWYRSSECRDGGALDLSPAPGWP